MNCINCNKKFYHDGVLVSADGDFVCTSKCETEYKYKQNDFLNRIIHDDKLMDSWWQGKQ